ncbi:MAG: hypothetical protein ACYTGX_09150, partial [Planctomycetota bacterium]
MRIRFQPTKSMIARWLIGIGILLLASTAFGQEPAADPGPLGKAIAQARTTLAGANTPAHRIALADLCFSRAEFQLGLAGREADDARRDRLTADARTHLAEAATVLAPALETLMKERADFMEKALDQAKPGEAPAAPAEALERRLQQAWLLDGQVRLARGELALAAAGADEAAKRLARKQVLAAITSCSDLEWEYDGWYVAYWSHITQARCYAALGRTGDAFTALQSIVALPKEPATAPVRTEAYRRIAELQLRAGRYAEAVDTFATASTDYPDLLASSRGQSLQLLAGTAHAKTGDAAKAVDAALKVIESERKLRYRAAMDRLAEWAGGWSQAPARVRFLQGDALSYQARAGKVPERYLAAIEAYKAAALGAGRDAATKQYAITAWRAVGACYEALDQYREAALAYERGAKRDDLDRKLAAECAKRAYQAWRTVVEQDDTPVNRDAMRQARARLITRFPDAEGAATLGYFAARDLEQAGKFLQAAQAYDAVPAGSPKRAQAVARAGGCYYREYARRAAQVREHGGTLTPSDTALLGEAERRCTRFLKLDGGSTSARALATYYLGRIAAERGDHARVVKLFATFDATFKGAPATLITDVLFLGVRSAVQVPDAPSAEAACARLVAFAPKSDRCSPAILEVAKLIADAGDRPVRAAELYLQWLEFTPDAGAAARLAVAVRARNVAEILPAGDAPTWWERAAELLRPLHGDPEGLTEEQQGIVLHSLWKCEDAQEHWAAAEPLAKALYEQRPKSERAAEAWLRCLRALIASDTAPGKTRATRLADARKLCGQLVRVRRQFTPGWWQAKEWQLEV